MKKSLYLTSALVAASVLAMGSTDSMAASKAKKMKMAISGSYKAVVGYAKQVAGFQVSTGTVLLILVITQSTLKPILKFISKVQLLPIAELKLLLR